MKFSSKLSFLYLLVFLGYGFGVPEFNSDGANEVPLDGGISAVNTNPLVDLEKKKVGFFSNLFRSLTFNSLESNENPMKSVSIENLFSEKPKSKGFFEITLQSSFSSKPRVPIDALKYLGQIGFLPFINDDSSISVGVRSSISSMPHVDRFDEPVPSTSYGGSSSYEKSQALRQINGKTSSSTDRGYSSISDHDFNKYTNEYISSESSNSKYDTPVAESRTDNEIMDNGETLENFSRRPQPKPRSSIEKFGSARRKIQFTTSDESNDLEPTDTNNLNDIETQGNSRSSGSSKQESSENLPESNSYSKRSLSPRSRRRRGKRNRSKTIVGTNPFGNTDDETDEELESTNPFKENDTPEGKNPFESDLEDENENPIERISIQDKIEAFEKLGLNHPLRNLPFAQEESGNIIEENISEPFPQSPSAESATFSNETPKSPSKKMKKEKKNSFGFFRSSSSPKKKRSQD